MISYATTQQDTTQTFGPLLSRAKRSHCRILTPVPTFWKVVLKEYNHMVVATN
jgi:hypothetical protein